MRQPSLRQLNYRHLYYFWAVAKEGHLTQVAEKLHVSQSALSAQIRQLEEQFVVLLAEESREVLLEDPLGAHDNRGLGPLEQGLGRCGESDR